MTKKLFVVLVVISALLISFSLVLAAKKAPVRDRAEVYVKQIISQQQATPMPRGTLSEKQDVVSMFPDRGEKASASYVSLSGSSGEIQAAPFQHTKDFCDLYGVGAYYITDWFWGIEYYANYQDPEEFGCVDVWPFEVVDVGFDLNIDMAYDIDVQGYVYSADLTDPACPVPGTELCATPVYTVSVPDAGWWTISLPLTEQCCVDGPYFAVIYIFTDLYGLGVDPVAEDDVSDVCRTYNDYGSGWEDLVVDYGWPGEMLLWSTGYTNPQNTCGGGPSDQCVLQHDNGSAASYFGSWEVGDQNAVYYDPATMCTECTEVYPINITSVRGQFYDHAGVGVPMDVIFHFYEAGDPCVGPGAEIYSFEATVDVFYPDGDFVVNTPEDVCLEDDFFLACEYNSGTAGSIPSLLFDNNYPVDTCFQWNEYLDYGWIEWWDFWSTPAEVGWLMLSCVGTCNDEVCNPGEECYLFQGTGAASSFWSGWGADDGVAKYYDPEDPFHACTTPVYPYRIDAFDVALYDHAGVGSVDIELAVYLECSDPCDGPGTEIYRTEPINVTTFYPDVATITLPDLLCMYEPFFVGVHYPNGDGATTPSVLFDDGVCDTCHAWMWYESAGYSPPWYEWSDFWAAPPPGCPMIYVLGYTESPACDIPQCDTTIEQLQGGLFASYYWKQPPNDEFLNMRFEMPADHGGRLEYFNWANYEGGTSGDPNPDFYVWLSDGLYPLDNNPPYQAIADFHISYGDIVYYPGWTTVQTYSHNLVFDPGEMFHIGVNHAFEAGDTLAPLSDDGTAFPSSDRWSGWYEGAWEGYGPYEMLLDAYICPFAPENPTFTMKCTPALGYATPGDPPTDVYQIQLTSVIGYAENVTLSLLSVSPTPTTFINATFVPNGVPCPYTADVAIEVGAGEPYGDYTLTFQGVGDDAQTKTCDVTLRLQPPFDEEIVEFFHGFQRTSNFGAVGNDVRDNFVWYGTNYLFDGTLISAIPGTPQADYFALDAYDCAHVGFVPTQHLVKTYDPWCPGGGDYEEYYGEVAYSNFYTTVFPGEYDSLFVIGLKDVDCTDFSIKIKIYYNPTSDPIPELWTGLFEDWDVGDAYNNWVEMDPDHNLAWQYDLADPSIVFGIFKAPFYDDMMHSIRGVNNAYYVWPNAGFCADWGLDSLWYLMTTAGYYPPVDINADSNDMSILVTPPPFSLNPGEKHIEIWIDFGRNLNDGLTWEQWYHKILRYCGFYRGDVNASDTLELPALDVSDLVYLTNYLYKGGPAPLPFADQGDVNGVPPGGKDLICPKNNVDASDVVYLINYVWKGGPAPVDYVRFIEQFWSRPSLFLNPNW
jgi:hypothetical protein